MKKKMKDTMKNLNKILINFLLFGGLLFSQHTLAESLKIKNINSKLNVKAQGIKLSKLLHAICNEYNLNLKGNFFLDPEVYYGASNKGLNEVLKNLAQIYKFNYALKDQELELTLNKVVNKTLLSDKVSREIASIQDETQKKEFFGWIVKKKHLAYSNVNDVSKRLNSLFSAKELRISTDLSRNTLWLYGTPATIKRVNSILEKEDLPQKQILINGRIIEATKNFAREFGMMLQGKTRNTGIGFKEGTLGSSGLLKYTIGSLNAIDIDLILNAAESDGDAKVITSPRIITGNNEKAVFNNNLSYSVRTSSAGGSTGEDGSENTGGSLIGGLETVTTGLSLTVTPRISNSDTIHLELDITNSEIDFGLSIDGLPGTSSSSLKTKVLLKNKQTAAVGGLIKLSRSDNVSGLPFLSQLPIIGPIFGTRDRKKNRQELIVLLTPTIIENRNDKKKLARELRHVREEGRNKYETRLYPERILGRDRFQK